MQQKIENFDRELLGLIEEKNSILPKLERLKGQNIKPYYLLTQHYDILENRLDDAKAEKDERTAKAKESMTAYRKSQSDTNSKTLITRAGAIAGAVGILILLVQIFVNSTRYHARLADLYASQANALQASGGNLFAAELLLEKLSPLKVDFGKTPQSLYEKALDAVRDAAKIGSKQKSGTG